MHVFMHNRLEIELFECWVRDLKRITELKISISSERKQRPKRLQHHHHHTTPNHNTTNAKNPTTTITRSDDKHSQPHTANQTKKPPAQTEREREGEKRIRPPGRARKDVV
eukprot:GABV01001836.1.p1 GENE.GABV01001836.1~~GABV01001836.1.p1  ORF type:complete len:110 (-),score=12.52 GABV01001836.1:241-570(-)